MTDEEPVSCSFCEKPQDRVRKIIVGSTGATICDECVDLCAEILDEDVPDWRGEVPPDRECRATSPSTCRPGPA